MKTRKITGTLEIVEKLNHSRNGNPRYLVKIGDVIARTQPDSDLSFEVPNLHGRTVTAEVGIYRGHLVLVGVEAV